MATAYVGPMERNINELTICDGYIEFEDVSTAIGRIAPVIRSIEDIGVAHNVEKFRGIGNWFDAIEINEENKIVMGYDVFWACVCLGQEKVLCKLSDCPSTPNIVNNKINVKGGDIIQPADRASYKQRIDEVCREHNPPLTVQWPADW